jgi:hypothetical protein
MNQSRKVFPGIKLIAWLLLCRQQTFAFTSRTHIATSHLKTPATGFHRSSTAHTAAASVRRHRCPPRLNAVPVSSRVADFLTRGSQRRPPWAPDWMPTWLWNLRPPVQLAVLLLAYLIHITVLCQHSIPFPVQLIPNERGHFQNIGLDT